MCTYSNYKYLILFIIKLDSMNWTKAFCFLGWLVLAILGIDLAFGWINLANTIANVAGAFLVLFIVFISVKTQCFTKLKFWKK